MVGETFSMFQTFFETLNEYLELEMPTFYIWRIIRKSKWNSKSVLDSFQRYLEMFRSISDSRTAAAFRWVELMNLHIGVIKYLHLK